MLLRIQFTGERLRVKGHHHFGDHQTYTFSIKIERAFVFFPNDDDTRCIQRDANIYVENRRDLLRCGNLILIRFHLATTLRVNASFSLSRSPAQNCRCENINFG